MSAQQFTDVAKIKLLEWRMAILWFILFTLVSLAAAILGGLQNCNWNQMDSQAKFMMCLAVFVSWGTTMMAFLSKGAKKVEQELDGGSVTRTTSQTESVQVSQSTKHDS